MGQKCLLWGILGHDWDVITRMNFTEFHMMLIFNALNILKKTHALGRSLVIFKIPASRRGYGGVAWADISNLLVMVVKKNSTGISIY